MLRTAKPSRNGEMTPGTVLFYGPAQGAHLLFDPGRKHLSSRLQTARAQGLSGLAALIAATRRSLGLDRPKHAGTIDQSGGGLATPDEEAQFIPVAFRFFPAPANPGEGQLQAHQILRVALGLSEQNENKMRTEM